MNGIQEIEQRYISSEVRFYTIEELRKLLGWSEMTVQKLFNDPSFPSADYGKSKIVEAHALIDYFSVRRSREDPEEGRNGELKNELKRRMQEKEAR